MWNIKLVSFVVCIILGAHPARAEQVIEWSNASVAGNGCPAGEAQIQIASDGNEISWTSNVFGFSLGGISAMSRFCRLSASVTIKPGYFLNRIREEIVYGGLKSTEGSSFSVGAQSRFLGFNTEQFMRDYPNGTDFNKGKVRLYRIQDFTPIAPASFFCDASNVTGLFQGTVSALGQVTLKDASLSFGVLGSSVGYKMIFEWSPCPA